MKRTHKRTQTVAKPTGTLAIVLGDQLNRDAEILRRLDRERDVVLMMEVRAESLAPRSHRQRTALFLSAMRHFAKELRARGFCVRYVELDDEANTQTLAGEIDRAIEELSPRALAWTEPGDIRVRIDLNACAERANLKPTVLPDGHFLTSIETFADWAKGRRRLRMEDFYRWQRRRLEVLVEENGQPRGEQWNFDANNRRPFGKRGPEGLPPKRRRQPDAITQSVLALVERELPELPGQSENFDWPVTRRQALLALRQFIRNRLSSFGRYQDAMWSGEPTLFHSLLSTSLNLKLLGPSECVDAAVDALDAGEAPIESVEGFVRQIIGWREFVRGIYWLEGPGYRDRNALGADRPLPHAYWTGQSDMNCLATAVGEVLDRGYGHHIQRLMVTGNFALLAGVEPRAVNDWYLGMFVDGVDWVTAPNVVGMALHADARPGSTEGVLGSKPYAASGRYIDRMSNYCRSCRFDPKKRIGPEACPFNALYWDFLSRNRTPFRANPRMALAMKNLDRIPVEELDEIRRLARTIRQRLSADDLRTT
ncbi:MAG: cryptochrome/photolyase family protein [Candidatus Binatia bacterium]|nr:cryptochrome/photolyase family protein [Candidatus Binatia bacterium]